MTRRPPRKPWFAAGVSLLLLLSAAWVWHVGHRGLFVLDESIVFDGAWRIAQGQVPYRDFYLPFGPVAFLLPGLAFRVFGPDFSCLVGVASFLSLLATAVSLRVAFRLTRSHWLSLLSGALTAVWFQAPFGIPWMEQTAFFFDLLALWALVEARLSERLLLAGLAGLCSTLAVLSKQNAGGLFMFVAMGCLAVPWRGRATLRALGGYAIGGALAAAIFAIWLWKWSSVPTFRHYWLDVSAETGLSRIETWKLMGTVCFQTLVSSSVPLFALATLVGLVGLCWPSRPDSPAIAMSAWLSLSLPQFHNAFQLTTNNDAPNNNAFVGICAAVTLGLIARARRQLTSSNDHDGWTKSLKRMAFGVPGRIGSVVVAGCLLYSLGDGLMVARDRNVQEFFGASFDQRLAVAGASRLRWGEPTQITPHFCGTWGDFCSVSAESAVQRAAPILERKDFEQIAYVLRERQENFFVFPDATLLYGLSGRISPQPLLYFHPGQSFLTSDRAQLDGEILESLKRNHVTLVVLERASFMGTHQQLAHFPRLRAWLETELEPELELGNYRLLRLRSHRAPVATLR